ncbi:hypothetical protein EFK50_18165 [Nocardioides marmoriginsengisoli]|uniref:Uncharacterized protein n=1 Tax=Nocardioides marmoriginsengisoli TaxID=661483 RepID=A0A3N0CCZ7_9ACTN|nr:DUF5995 family protein [Nocardioides marmoriginsengisoli]RNL61288.1 hypothetical protein EFK50_18165 [Nocardioides marmoriginsengisoli]
MHLRRTLKTAVVGLTATLTLGSVATPAQAAGTVGLDTLLTPTLLDPVINLLGALPTPYKPYTGPICVSGAPQCIEDVITEMEDRLEPLAASCSHDAIFSLAYLRVTQNVKAAADSGYFQDRKWLTQIDAVFAEMYFDTMDTWKSGNKAGVPKAWRLALQASEDRTLTGLGDFMMNMNAHINNDFPYVLAKVGLTAADGTSHKPDHNAYNQRLDSLYHPVFDEEAARFDPMFNKLDLGPVDEVVVGAIMRGWREVVWRNAEALANAPAALRPLVEREIAEYAAGQAQLIKVIFKGNPTKRDAYCATHG